MKGKFEAFISYSHGDTRWGEWLQKSLEGYRIPKPYIHAPNNKGEKGEAKLGKIFRDRDEFRSGLDLAGAIRIALDASENLIVICSPGSARSEYVNQEIIEFKRLGRDNHIHALIVEGEPNASRVPGKEHLECLPPALRFELDKQGNISDRAAAEVLAPDARPNKDGKNRALIKLIAGLLGVDFDVLYQRERRRQKRRMVTNLITIFAVMVLLAAGFNALKNIVIDPPAIRSLVNTARDSYALLCRERETLERKEVGLRIAKESGDTAMVEAFSSSIEAHKANIDKFWRDYGNNIANLGVFKNAIVLTAIRELEQVERLRLRELTGNDYEHFIDTGQLPSPETMSEKCPMSQ